VIIYIIAIIIYLIFLFGLSFFLKRKIKTAEDFLLARRKLTAPVLIMTLVATWIGSGSIFGSADLAYHHGYASLWGSVGAWVAIILMYFIADKIRATEKFTIPEILESHYGQTAKNLASIITIISYTTIVSYQFKGGGRIVEIISNGAISLETGIIITAFFVISYTFLAGLVSAAYADIVNGILMIVGFALTLPFIFKAVGGVSYVFQTVRESGQLSLFGNMSPREAFSYFIPMFLLLLSNANMYQRFFAAKDGKEAKKAVMGWITGTVIIDTLIVTIAIAGSVVIVGLNVPQSETIILRVATELIPPSIGVLLIGATVAIIISTADSFLLVPASNIANDLYRKIIKCEANDNRVLLASKIAVIIVGIMAYLLAQFFPRILKAAFAAFTIYGASITPALISSFFWKRVGKHGAIFSIIGGSLITIIWEILIKIKHGSLPLGVEAIYPAFIVSLLGLFIGVIFFPNNS